MPAEVSGGRVLVLHGSRQTGDLFLGRMNKLRKQLEKQSLQTVAPTALFVHADDVQMRQWWNRVGNEYQGLIEQTIPQLLEIWNNKEGAPFVGMIGFSQGARLVHLSCLAHAAGPQTYFAGLQFCILSAGYEAPLPAGFEEAFSKNISPATTPLYHGFIQTPSLHVWGESDELITPERSQGLLPYYNNPQIHVHEGGHHFPMRAASVRAYVEFIRASRIASVQSVIAAQPMPYPTNQQPDEDTAQQQCDEVEALTAIFPQEFRLLSVRNKVVGEYKHPIRYQVDLIPSSEGIWPRHPIAVEVRYPFNYPQDSLPSIKLVHDNNMMEFSTEQAAALMDCMLKAARMEEGMPCVLSCIYAAREFFETGAIATMTAPALVTSAVNSSLEDRMESESDEDDNASRTSTRPGSDFFQSSSRERIQAYNLQGLEIARELLGQMWRREGLNESLSPPEANNNSWHGKGGHWTFTIGLVGKPSAGKSTFFNAATAFARQRDDADNLLGGATMAPHPFTTIDPNVGYCLVPAPRDSCPENDDSVSGLSTYAGRIGSTHGRDHLGRRLLPVLLKDVAGLVPGAYQGRGRGNKFLNDLTDADVLIHVLDASGTADVEGNDLGPDTDGTTSPEASNPLNDMSWIRTELVEWVFSNLMYKWDTIRRRGRSKLADMFAGYGQSQTVTTMVLTALEKYMEHKEGRVCALDHLDTWDAGDVHRLVSAFLGVRFPMALALNKCDLPSSSNNVASIQAALPIHGAHVGIPLSARSEMNFIRHHTEQALGVMHKKQRDGTNEQKVPEGVWACLQSAISLRQPVIVFPVADFESYTPLPGLFKHATSDPSLPSVGFVQCLKAAGGSAPSLWNAETSAYHSSPEKMLGKSPVILRDALVMKPGSTVDDVFSTLKRLGALGGDFVRAEAVGALGSPSRPVPRTQKVNRGNCILKINTSKRIARQKK